METDSRPCLCRVFSAVPPIVPCLRGVPEDSGGPGACYRDLLGLVANDVAVGIRLLSRGIYYAEYYDGEGRGMASGLKKKLRCRGKFKGGREKGENCIKNGGEYIACPAHLIYVPWGKNGSQR